jgi:diaminohydroxyphosphoribosylaminopyrimidine deaminase/5-amino-6-(5-phosphoribosylamino)uracil reductase
MTEEEKYMEFTLELAKLGLGFTSPNPCVGAVIVNNGRVVGIGYHKKKGDKHAEIRAIEDARGHLEGSTLYVNLEPCTVHGATPPCAPVIAESGIKRVVISNLDPNPAVNGNGVQYLRSRGIDVCVGVLEREGAFLNRFFFHYMKSGTPYVIVKVATSIDGFIADRMGSSKWISGEESRRYVHQMRGEVDGIMVGKGTVKKDDPELTPRKVYSPRIPDRIIVAREPLENFDYKVFKGPGRVFIITGEGSKWDIPQNLEQSVVLIRAESNEDGTINLMDAMQKLGTYGLHSILCEGGSFLIGEILKQGLLDEFVIFYAPMILGDGIRVFGNTSFSVEEAFRDFDLYERKEFGMDVMMRLVKHE